MCKPCCRAVATLDGGLIGSSVRGADLSLTSKHIWSHLYPSKCGLGPDLLFWRESNSISLPDTMPYNFFFPVVLTTREIRGGCTTRHVTSALGVCNSGSEPQRWLNFTWTPFLHNSAWLHEVLYLRWANSFACMWAVCRERQLWWRAQTWTNTGRLMQH